MRILHISDLHRCDWDKNLMVNQNEWIKSLLCHIDLTVITGDVFEPQNYNNKEFNPYSILAELFYNKPVVFCLGNHEFFYNEPKWVRNFYAEKYDAEKYNVHCLDVVGSYDIGNIRLLGNVLWYDGSMKTVKNQRMHEFAHGNWMDKSIRHFRWEDEHELCRKQIEGCLETKGDRKTVLCTHCVPHNSLNLWVSDIGSLYNAYSGVADFLDRYKFDWCLCGHTHRRVVCEINGCKCVNVGNDYRPPFTHYVLEL